MHLCSQREVRRTVDLAQEVQTWPAGSSAVCCLFFRRLVTRPVRFCENQRSDHSSSSRSIWRDVLLSGGPVGSLASWFFRISKWSSLWNQRWRCKHCRVWPECSANEWIFVAATEPWRRCIRIAIGRWFRFNFSQQREQHPWFAWTGHDIHRNRKRQSERKHFPLSESETLNPHIDRVSYHLAPHCLDLFAFGWSFSRSTSLGEYSRTM